MLSVHLAKFRRVPAIKIKPSLTSFSKMRISGRRGRSGEGRSPLPRPLE